MRPTHPSLRVGMAVALWLLALTMLVPFLWMVTASLSDLGDLFSDRLLIFPWPIRWRNYVDLFREIPFARMIWNSVVVSGLATFGTLFSCSMAGFAFARLVFPGRTILFALVLSTLMIPAFVTVVPVFLIFRWLGWVNTHLPLIVPAFFGQAFGIFLLRQFFLALPKDIDDAARIDGCGVTRVFLIIALPLAVPALVTLALFAFMGNWNNLLSPLIYLVTVDKLTVPAGLAYFQYAYAAEWNLFLAGALLSVLPTLALFLVAQDTFVRGIVTTGLKQ
ncbi:MAG: carbohydrate ABC transporter permease [bacterium]